MKCLIINTFPQNDATSHEMIHSWSDGPNETEAFYADNFKIGHCIGCTHCWLKTPGVCAVKDDWELLFKKFVQADTVIFMTEAKLGFVPHPMKNIIDRLIPLAVPYTELYRGEMRHTSRYKKCWNIGLVYSGDGDNAFLNDWLERVALNFFSKSLGAYSFEESEELRRGLGDL